MAMGKGAVFRLYVRNFTSELLHRRPKDTTHVDVRHVMPGYEPFLLCDFHVHTRWSDGELTVREVVDLYGETGKFDVIAITDHILMKKDLLARPAGSRRSAGVLSGCAKRTFDDYLADIRTEASRALRKYGMLVIPGAEVTQNASVPRRTPTSSLSASSNTSAPISRRSTSCGKSGGRMR